MLKKLEGCYDEDDETNMFDLGVQYMMPRMITFPRVESSVSCANNAPGCTSYPVFKGLVPDNFEGGSFTWISKSPSNDGEPYNHSKFKVIGNQTFEHRV